MAMAAEEKQNNLDNLWISPEDKADFEFCCNIDQKLVDAIFTEQDVQKQIKEHAKLGPVGRKLCWMFNSWIVGGAVAYLSGESKIKPKDIDIIVPLDEWIEASKLIPEGATANRFGGFKFNDNGIDVNVWADEIGKLFLMAGKDCKMYQPKYKCKIGLL